MGNILNHIQHLPSEKKYILANDSELYDKFDQIIDEEISKIDSYQKLMQLKRSIDSLIEILYSNASSEDIETELETTKHTQAKLESQKRVQDKKRKIVESIVAYVAMQQQEVNYNAHSNNLNHIEKENTDINEMKDKLKLQVKEVLFVVLANRMDPEKRAGETESSNTKHAKRYGREDEDHKRHQNSSIFSSLLKVLFNVLFGINVDISSNMSFTTKIKTENQNKKGMSI